MVKVPMLHSVKKPRALTKVIDSIIAIHSFDQKCVIIKGLLQ